MWIRTVGCFLAVRLEEGLDIVAYARATVQRHYFTESLEKHSRVRFQIQRYITNEKPTSVSFLTAARKVDVNFDAERLWKVPRALVTRSEGNPLTKLAKVWVLVVSMVALMLLKNEKLSGRLGPS